MTERHVCCTVCGEEENKTLAQRGGYDLDTQEHRWLCTVCDGSMKEALPELTDAGGKHKLTVADRIKLYRSLHDMAEKHLSAARDKANGSHTAKLAGVV